MSSNYSCHHHGSVDPHQQHQFHYNMEGFLIPSPIPTRRTRTDSCSQRASEGPVKHGVCKSFCRERGHGFITPSDAGNDIFVHISDIEGEYVPQQGDEVTYKTCTVPPKNEKVQAVEVVIIHMAPGTTHHKWDERANISPQKTGSRIPESEMKDV